MFHIIYKMCEGVKKKKDDELSVADIRCRMWTFIPIGCMHTWSVSSYVDFEIEIPGNKQKWQRSDSFVCASVWNLLLYEVFFASLFHFILSLETVRNCIVAWDRTVSWWNIYIRALPKLSHYIPMRDLKSTIFTSRCCRSFFLSPKASAMHVIHIFKNNLIWIVKENMCIWKDDAWKHQTTATRIVKIGNVCVQLMKSVSYALKSKWIFFFR